MSRRSASILSVSRRGFQCTEQCWSSERRACGIKFCQILSAAGILFVLFSGVFQRFHVEATANEPAPRLNHGQQ